MKLILSALLCILFSVTMFPQNTTETICYVKDSKAKIREHNVDFIKLVLDVKFEPETGKVFGIADYEFTPLQQKIDTLFLDAIQMKVNEILVDGKPAPYKVDSAGITIRFEKPLSWESTHNLKIDYEATPRKGIYFVGWNKPITANPENPYRTRKQIWTQGQGVDNRFWIPGYDDVNDKLITALNITFNKKYEVISNGTLVGKIESGNDTNATWRYAMDKPHAFYLIMLAIGEYEHKDFTSKNGITTKQYYYPDREEAAEITYKYSAEMMDWLTEETGVAYPWKSYANVPVQEFLYGAMENTTATIYTDNFLKDAGASFWSTYAPINAHELAHQWFGDYVTEYSSASHWLHESFATYYSKIFMRTVEGDDAYAWNRRVELLSGLNADNQNDFPLAHSQAGSARHYQKGSYVLDMLRYVVGDEQYKKVIKEYLLSHAYGQVTSYDLQMQFMKTLGINLDWFFDEWVYKSGYPVYEVSYTTTPQATTFVIKQTQEITPTRGLFKMPVHLQIVYANNSKTDTLVWIENAETTITVANKNLQEIAYTLFDPGMMVYSKVNFNKEFPELKMQALFAENYIDRHDAVYAMKDIPVDVKRDVLLAVFAKEKHSEIKDKIIAQLIEDDNKKSLRLIQTALTHPDAEVRHSVLGNTVSVHKSLVKYYEALLHDSSYANVETALKILCKYHPDKKEKYLSETDGVYGMNNNVRITWLEIYYSIDSVKHIKELTEYAGYSYEFRTRNDAFDALKTINYCNETVVMNLFDAATSFNSRLAGPARSTLQFFMQTPKYQVLIKNLYSETKWEDWQRARLEPVFKAK